MRGDGPRAESSKRKTKGDTRGDSLGIVRKLDPVEERQRETQTERGLQMKRERATPPEIRTEPGPEEERHAWREAWTSW